MRQRDATALVLSLVAIALVAAPAGAGAASACNPDPSGFCVDYSLSLSSATSAAPFDLDLAFDDSSASLLSDPSTWLAEAKLNLGETLLSTPVVTNSSTMPDGLRIAGGGPCTDPGFADCVAGHGTLVASISGAGPLNGIHTGTFGIDSIANVNPPAPGDLAQYRVNARGCVQSSLGPCSGASATATTFIVDVPQPATANASGFHVSLPTTFVFDVVTGLGTAHVDGSLDQVVLHLDGDSATLVNGSPAGQSYTVIALPHNCGSVTGNASFTSRAPARVVTFPQPFSVGGCPNAALSAGLDALTASFDGSASTTPVVGRSIAKWHWDFGDGSPQVVTAAPTTMHEYASAGPKTATLTVEDSAGALSSPAGVQVDPQKRATTTSVSAKAKKKIKVRGLVKPASATGRVSVQLLRGKKKKFVAVKNLTATLKAGAFSAKFKNPKRAKKCEVVAAYAGDATHAESKASAKFKC